METRSHTRFFTFLMALMCLSISTGGWGQGIETFDNLPTTSSSSYLSRTWTGTDGVQWTAEGARTDQTINGKAICWGNSGTRNVISPVYPGGMGVLTFNYTRAFTGTNPRSLEVYVNGVQIGSEIIVSPTSNDVVQYSEVINISGNVVLEIQSTGAAQVKVDDISWTAYSAVNPFLTVLPTSLSNLDYMEGNGPSASQSFELTGANLDGTDVSVNLDVLSDFEVSLDDIAYGSSINLTAFDGSATTLYVRLKAGLGAASYTDNITISGGGATNVMVNLSGDVVEPFDIPYFNGLRDQNDWDDAATVGFAFNGTFFESGAGGYVRIPLNADITSPEIDLSQYSYIITSFSLTTFGGNTGQELTVFVSNDNGATYTALDTFSVPGSYTSFTQLIDVTALNGNGRIKYEMTGGSNQVRFRDLSIAAYDYVYDGSNWMPSNPGGLSTATDDLLIMAGETSLTADTEAHTIVVQSGSTLNVEAVLKINGNLTNNGSLVFISNATTTGQLDVVPSSSQILGEVTVQRYIPARRAFRLLSSPVTTAGSIHDNWQEGALNATDDPNPGYGTHITGSDTGLNGFDASPSGNPSLFTLNNSAQSWEDVTNTDVNTLTAGVPYRILVRGDRSIDLTSNSSIPTNTILQTTGTLVSGTYTDTNFSPVANDFNFFGNPYQAAVNMNDVIATSTNINPGFYYIWDPTLGGTPIPGQPGGRGAYVTVELPAGTNSSASDANQYLQPGQAGFVLTNTAGAASITFEEAHKAVNQPQTSVFSTTSQLDLRLYEATSFADGSTASDALRIRFADNGSNDLNTLDAPKMYNQDENLASVNGNKLLSVESRALPQIGELIPLFTDQYRNTAYVFEAMPVNLDGIAVYLRDHHTGTETLLENNETTLYPFSVDPGNAATIADDRFELLFEELLGVNDLSFGNGFVVFPNPIQNQNFYIATRKLEGQEVSVRVYTTLGQQIVSEDTTVATDGKVQVNLPKLPSGVYTVTLSTVQGSRFTTKIIQN